MAARRKIIKVLDHDRKPLVTLYLKRGRTIEQLESLPDEMYALAKDWNRICGTKHSPRDVFHYMRNERKCGRWVKLGGNCKEMPPLPVFTSAETEALVTIYVENVALFGHGSDDIAYSDEIGELLEKSFFEITGRGLPAHQLIQKLTALRKRGRLPKVGDMPKQDSSGFDDREEEPA